MLKLKGQKSISIDEVFRQLIRGHQSMKLYCFGSSSRNLFTLNWIYPFQPNQRRIFFVLVINTLHPITATWKHFLFESFLDFYLRTRNVIQFLAEDSRLNLHWQHLERWWNYYFHNIYYDKFRYENMNAGEKSDQDDGKSMSSDQLLPCFNQKSHPSKFNLMDA